MEELHPQNYEHSFDTSKYDVINFDVFVFPDPSICSYLPFIYLVYSMHIM